MKLHGVWHTATGLAFTMSLLVWAAAPRHTRAQTVGSEPTDQEKATYYSLYYEEFKNGNFEAALPGLRWILEHAPVYPRNDARNFERLLAIYDTLAATAIDPGVKRAYLDSSLAVYDTVLAGVPVLDTFEWIVNKGRFIQQHRDLLPDRTALVPALYREAYRIDPSRLHDYYLQVLIQDLVQRDDHSGALAFMDELSGRFPDRTALIEYIDQVRNQLIRSPGERILYLESKRLEEPANETIHRELFELYRAADNRPKMREIAERLAEIDPGVSTFRIMAILSMNEGDVSRAAEYYLAVIGTAGDHATADDHYNLGIAYTRLGRLAEARTAFERALETNPNYGRAYVGIGDLYVTAVANCSTFERDDRAVYWLAVDKYIRARDVDPALADLVNQKIATYRRSFPDPEMLFFKGWKVGQSFRIDYGCYTWIDETTTVKNPP